MHTENDHSLKEKKTLTQRDKYPCQGCESRTLGCHDKCLKYYASKLAAEKRKAAELKNRSYESDANSVEMRRTGRKQRQI